MPSLDEPLDRVLGLDARASGIAAWLGLGSTSIVLFEGVGALVLLVAWARARPVEPAIAVVETEIQTEDVPAPQVDRSHAAQPAPRQPHEPSATARTRPPLVPTRSMQPDDPVDLTERVSGHSGTDDPRDPPGPDPGGTRGPRPSDPPGGEPTRDLRPRAQPAPLPDRSRPASLGGAGQWSCPFPPEADTSQVDDAYVTLQVDVAANGAPTRVQVLSDPGNGFGREARRCAMSRSYETALDHDGAAISGTTRPFRVHFSR